MIVLVLWLTALIVGLAVASDEFWLWRVFFWIEMKVIGIFGRVEEL
jgi:hypothetical protein